MSDSATQLDHEILRSVREHAVRVRCVDRITADLLDMLYETHSTVPVSTQLEHAKQLLVAGCQAGGVKPPVARHARRELQLN